jgi:hypothetical protein
MVAFNRKCLEKLANYGHCLIPFILHVIKLKVYYENIFQEIDYDNCDEPTIDKENVKNKIQKLPT